LYYLNNLNYPYFKRRDIIKDLLKLKLGSNLFINIHKY